MTHSQPSRECLDAEPLIAASAAGVLDADDRTWLDEHLAQCDRCFSTTAVLLLDLDTVDEIAAPFDGDAMPTADSPHSSAPFVASVEAGPIPLATRRGARGLAVSAVVVVAAAAVAVLWISRGPGEPVDHTMRAQTDEPISMAGAARARATVTLPTPGSKARADALVAESKELAKRAEFGKALRLCQEALGLDPDHAGAAMVCVVAACNLKSETLSARYIRKISGARQAMARQICLRNGVNLPPASATDSRDEGSPPALENR